jgi:hypothetical protein
VARQPCRPLVLPDSQDEKRQCRPTLRLSRHDSSRLQGRDRFASVVDADGARLEMEAARKRLGDESSPSPRAPHRRSIGLARCGPRGTKLAVFRRSNSEGAWTQWHAYEGSLLTSRKFNRFRPRQAFDHRMPSGMPPALDLSAGGNGDDRALVKRVMQAGERWVSVYAGALCAVYSPTRQSGGAAIDDAGRGRYRRSVRHKRRFERTRLLGASQMKSATPLASACALSAASLSTSSARRAPAWLSSQVLTNLGSWH